MANFEVLLKEVKNVPVIQINGYLNELAGNLLHEIVEKALVTKPDAIIVDFNECAVINSLGVAALMTMIIKCSDELQTKVIFVGLDSFKTQVLRVSGILPLVEVVANTEEGLSIL